MTNISDEMIMAYADGELEKEHVLVIENALKNDAGLRAKIARHHALRAEVELAFNEVDNTAVPEAILDLLQQDSNKVETNNVVNLSRSWWQPTSIAAAITIAFIVGLVIDAPANNSNDLMATTEQFANLMNTTTSGITTMGIEVQASFLKPDGSLCRTFQNKHSDNLMDGLSCREADGYWKMVVLTPAIPADVYLPASGDSTNIIAQATDGMKKLSVEEENNYLTK